jgi:hypothetical protein
MITTEYRKLCIISEKYQQLGLNSHIGTTAKTLIKQQTATLVGQTPTAMQQHSEHDAWH